MPITLVTGLPGAGKTLYTIDKVKALSEKEKRTVYYNGINDLQLSWHLIDDPKKWPDLPFGSIIVLDECQDMFPVHETKLPSLSYVLELAKHRHKGFDIWLITQHPMNVHAYVRRLIDKHFHLIRAFGMQASNVHEWNKVADYPEKSKKDDQTSIFPFPKDVYKFYKSAELHTIQRKIPKKIYFVLFIPVLLGAIGYFVYSKLNPQHQRELITGKNNGSLVIGQNAASVAKVESVPAALTYIQARTPELADFPHTSPVYKEIVKPVRAPYPAACVKMGKRCECYTQQATKLQTSKATCEQIVKVGYFLDFDDQKIASNELQRVSGRSHDVDSDLSHPVK